jgi:hypothetical protein
VTPGARSGETRRVHPKRLHAVAAAFLAYEPFDEARDGGAGLFAMARQVALPDGPAVAAAQALHANAPERSFVLPTRKRSHSHASRNADADLDQIGMTIRCRESGFGRRCRMPRRDRSQIVQEKRSRWNFFEEKVPFLRPTTGPTLPYLLC